MYKLTIVTDVTNTGSNSYTKEFDSYYELQDYIELQTEKLDDYEKELFYYYLKIEKVGV